MLEPVSPSPLRLADKIKQRILPFRRSLLIALAALFGLGALFYVVAEWGEAPADNNYRFARVDRGEIVATVNATGTINPTTTVIVGSQLSGQVVEILADYNSEVQAGQIVARLNSDQIRAKLDAARADLEQIRAQKRMQEGQIEKVKAETDKAHAARDDAQAQVTRQAALLDDSERIFQRQSELRSRGFAAEQAFDTARSNRDAQQAALESAHAQVHSAEAAIASLAADLQVAQANLSAVTAQIAQREASVRQIEVDLRNTDIRSPVSGVVVQRNVELGQTVAASLQAPELFRIADDLRRMEISANIDETDVGRIKPGQRVAFTVNAFPGRTFEGEVKQVRLGSETVNNVVIYTTIITTENPNRELLPGMTANLRIETDRRENVLRIPNATLRFRPQDMTPAAGMPGPAPMAIMRPTTQGTAPQGTLAKGTTAHGGPASQGAQMMRGPAEDSGGQIARVFILDANRKPEGVTIRIGASDGAMTEVISGLDQGQDVIVGGGGRTDATARGPRFGF